MAGVILQTYLYTYGAGDDPNRKIEFYRQTQSDPRTIQARISALHQGEWILLNDLAGNRISVEMMSTTEKMQAMIRARDGHPVRNQPDALLTNFPLESQSGILYQLDPENGKRIEITNDVGGPRGFESVVQLNIFDPR